MRMREGAELPQGRLRKGPGRVARGWNKRALRMRGRQVKVRLGTGHVAVGRGASDGGAVMEERMGMAMTMGMMTIVVTEGMQIAGGDAIVTPGCVKCAVSCGVRARARGGRAGSVRGRLGLKVGRGKVLWMRECAKVRSPGRGRAERVVTVMATAQQGRPGLTREGLRRGLSGVE